MLKAAIMVLGASGRLFFQKGRAWHKSGGGMAARGISGRTVAFLVVAFLLLVAIHLLWQGAEGGPSGEKAPGLKVSTVKIEGQEARVLISSEDSSALDADEALRKKELNRQLRRLQGGNTTDRRDAAFRMVFIADESCVGFLLAGLKDADAKVADRCAKALMKLWRRSRSAGAERLFKRGLAAYDAGRTDEALGMFTNAAQLDGSIPDLYRLRAEILLNKSRPDEALADCEKAIAIEENHFRARYIAALCFLEMGSGEKAIESVTEALKIYPHFEQAEALRERVRSLQNTGDL